MISAAEGRHKMNESYAEAGVKRKPDAKTYLIRFGALLIVGIVLVLGVLLGNSIIMFVGAILVVLAVYLLPQLNVSYEYIFCQGQFDFDKIMGGSKRKTVLKLDMDNVEVLAPVQSHALDTYTYEKVQVKDFTSGDKNAKVYAIVGHDGTTTYKVLFEPSEKMLVCAKQKSPRKVMEY